MTPTLPYSANPAFTFVFEKPEDQGSLDFAAPVVVALMLYLSMHGFIPILMQGQGTPDGVDGATGLIAQCVFLAVFALIALPSVKRFVRGSRHAGPLLAIGLVAVLSCLWSQDPAMSLRRGIMLLSGSLFALFLHVRYSRASQLRLLLLTGIVAGGLSVVFAVLFPGYGQDSSFHSGAWQGIYSQKNSLARACVFFMMIATVMWGRSGKKSLLAGTLLLMFSLLLIMSGSATAFILAGVMLPVTWALRYVKKLPRNETVVASLIMIGAAVAGAVVLFSNLDTVLEFMGRDSSLTGRTVIWEGAWEAITKHPLVGYGYSAFWTGLKGESANVILAAKWMVPMAHNGFLDVWLQLGAVGLGLVLFTVCRGFTAAIWCLRHIGGEAIEFAAAMILFTVLSNLDETSLIALHELLWVIFCLAYLNLTAAQARSKSQRRLGQTQVVAAQLEFEPASL